MFAVLQGTREIFVFCMHLSREDLPYNFYKFLRYEL